MARDFESGSSQYLECATTPITAVDLTISAWIKPETAIASVIAGIFDDAGDLNWFALRIGGAGPGIQAAASNTTENAAVTSTNVAAGVWQHACATFGPAAGTDRAAYLNGAGKGTNTTNRTPAGLDRVTIGARGSATRTSYFDGLIAEVTIWSAQLNDNEVASLAGRVHPLTVRSAAIVAYWPLYGVGSPEPNLGTSALNMTVNGAALSEEHPPIAPFPPAERIWLPSGVSAGPTTHNGAATLSGAGALAAAGTVPREIFGSTAVLSSVVADNFNDNSIDAGIWQTPYTDPGCTVTETGQRLEIGMASGDFYGALGTDYQGPLVGTQQIARLVQHHGSGYTGGNSYVNVQSGVGPWTGYSLEVGADVMRLLEYGNDTSASEMAVLSTPAFPFWIRLRVTAAVVTLETSADGSVWTQLHAEPTLAGASAITDAYGELGAHTTPGESGVTVWDDYSRSSLLSGLLGSGALSASGGRLVSGAAALSGTGAVAASGVVSVFGATHPVVGLDTFTRTLSDSWGSADMGGVWMIRQGVVADYDVAGGVGTLDMHASGTRSITLGLLEADVDVAVRGTWDVPASGLNPLQLMARWVSVTSHYYAQLRHSALGTLQIAIVKFDGSATTLAGPTTVTTAHVAGSWWWLRFQVRGGVLKAKAWSDGSPEPDWQVTVSDSALAAPGAIGIKASGSAVQTTASFDQLVAWDLAAGLPGVGALAASGTVLPAAVEVFGAAALSGAGGLSVVALRGVFGAVALSASGSLLSGASVSFVAAAVLSGAGWAAASGYTIVFSRPDEVVSGGGWSPSTGTLWGCVDEAVASDADFIYSSSTLSLVDTCELGLQPVDDPAVGYGHAVSYRFRKDVLGGSTVQLTVSLVQGTTVIATWVHADVEAVVTVRQELSPAEANSISDYGDLRLRFEAVEA